jgi:hypothetical protein
MSSGARKHWAVIGLGLAGFSGFAGFVTWAFWATSKMGGGWHSLAPIWPFVVGGLIAVGLLTGALMWLVFYSADHGYDDPVDVDEPPAGAGPP